MNMYRCKISKGIHKGVFGFKIVICLIILLYFLSFTSILPDNYSIFILNNAGNIRSNDESEYLKTSMFVNSKTYPTTPILVSTLANSYGNTSLKITMEHDEMLNEVEHKENDEQSKITNEDHIQNEEDYAVNEEDHVISEEDRMFKKDNNTIDQDDDIVIEEDLTISEELSLTNIKNPIFSKTDDDVVINERYFGAKRKQKNIGCMNLFKREASGASRVRKIVTQEFPPMTPKKYSEITKNCSSFIEERGYITHHLTTEEKQFPIAFSILMYKNVEQVERLLRAIYRPQNIYCIHVDSKTSIDIHKAMSGVSNCFENVFVLRKRINVIWGKMSVLTPELLCMEELWKRHKKWKYFINLTGQEFPLKTNYQLVKILQAYNGANDVESTVKQFSERCRGKSKTRPPHGIRVTKGAVHVAVTREYVNYVLHDRRARDILKWMSYSCDIPDEAFFTTLNHNPHLQVPGSYNGHPETTPISNKKKPFLARYKNRLHSHIHRWPCHGKWVRSMCIFNFRDLHQLSTRKELFANKFHLYDNPLPYACMEELIFNRTRDEFQGIRTFDARWYSTLGFVKRHL